MSFCPLRLAALAFVAALAGCATTDGVTPAAATVSPTLGKEVQSRIVNAQGAAIGFATFQEGPHGVVIRLEFNPRGLTPGWHGVHLHQSGDCADFAAGFQASGAHVGHPTAGGTHGLLNPVGPEVGDLANVFAPDAGPFGAEIYTGVVTLGSAGVDARMPLLGPQGAALIVHANADDHKTQPIGGAGARVACAALKP